MVTVPVDRGWERGPGLHSTTPKEGLGARLPARKADGEECLALEGPCGPMEEAGMQTEKDESASNCCNGGLRKAAVALGFKFICFSRNYTQRETATPPPHSPLRVSVFR